MKFANVRELKNKTSELLRITDKGKDVIITCWGKPRAIIQHFSDLQSSKRPS
jgi:prevent-host-death family protein